MKFMRIALVMALALQAGAALALDIVLANDDGFETANIRALYQRLKAAGYDVVISAPTQNNSGRGAAVEYQREMKPLDRPTRYGGVPAGAPGVGTDPHDPDIHYVDGTPVTAMLYGLDVVAAKRWGGPPDLVISGPNEGGNVGPSIVSSGTVGNALYAINRGIPAIAVSDGPWDRVSHQRLTPQARSWAVADVVVRLVGALEAGRRPGKPLLPPGSGLNVNLPNIDTAQLATAPFVRSHVGGTADYVPVFFERLDDSALAVRLGQGSVLPGLSSVTPEEKPPAGVVLPGDDDPRAELHVISRGAIAVSVIQGVPEGTRQQDRAVARQLRRLFAE